MATIKRESDEVFGEGLGNKLPTGRVALQPFFERRPFMSALVADDRIYGIGESLLGPDFFLIGTEGNLHSGDTYWHGGGLWAEKVKAVKIVFYPEPLTAAAGSLRVVPGSHRRGSPDLLEPLRHGKQEPSSPSLWGTAVRNPLCGLGAWTGRLGGLYRGNPARGVWRARRPSSARDQLHGESEDRVEGARCPEAL